MARKFVAENRIAIELITGDQMIRALEESAQRRALDFSGEGGVLGAESWGGEVNGNW